MKIFIRTVGQSLCDEWFLQRVCRISASEKPHFIKTCLLKNLDILARKFVEEQKDLSHLRAIKHGNKFEKVALLQYKKDFKAEVVPAGLFIKPDKPFLCASPDGVVIKNGSIEKIVEIKCPYTCSTKPIFNEVEGKFNVTYLHKDAEKVTYLSSTHKYYTQCQIQMYVCGLSTCDFYVWSPIKSELVAVTRDEKFLLQLIPKIEHFYFSYLLKAIMNKDINEP